MLFLLCVSAVGLVDKVDVLFAVAVIDCVGLTVTSDLTGPPSLIDEMVSSFFPKPCSFCMVSLLTRCLGKPAVVVIAPC